MSKIDYGTMEDAIFICPECQSTHWGTDMTTDTGYCHGQGCKFHWPRSEDAKVMHPTGKAKSRNGTGMSN